MQSFRQSPQIGFGVGLGVAMAVTLVVVVQKYLGSILLSHLEFIFRALLRWLTAILGAVARVDLGTIHGAIIHAPAGRPGRAEILRITVDRAFAFGARWAVDNTVIETSTSWPRRLHGGYCRAEVLGVAVLWTFACRAGRAFDNAVIETTATGGAWWWWVHNQGRAGIFPV